MQAITPQTTARAQAPTLASARPQSAPRGPAATQRLATQKQSVARNAVQQRRALSARAAARSGAARTVARAGGDVLVVGSSGQVRLCFVWAAGQGWRSCLLRQEVLQHICLAGCPLSTQTQRTKLICLQTAARVVVNLLKAGFKVTAGAPAAPGTVRTRGFAC